MVLQVVAPPQYFFGSLLSGAVLLGALVYSPRTTALVGAVGVLLLLGLDLWNGVGFDPQLTGAIITLAVVTGLAVLLSYARHRTLLQLSRVRAVAVTAQRALLRPLPERLGTLRLAGFYRAADDEALIGGDLYSVQPTPFGVRVLVGDVRGKGLGATETVATVLAVFREAAVTYPALPDVASRMDQALAIDRETLATGPDLEEMFTTAVLMEFPEDRPVVRVLDRGHPPLLLLAPDGVSLAHTEPGLPLGLSELASFETPTQTFELPPDRVLVAYSDGVTEARGPDGGFYPLSQRMYERFVRTTSADRDAAARPTEVARFIQRDVVDYARSLDDDMVVVAIRHEARDSARAEGPPALTPPSPHPVSPAPPD
ncbi:serine/threonine-protein phosphatase [Streptomyces sp. AJS327]|nr:serine/threonine-protein phosphatase [Streptomyces sp. AJS327]